MANKFAWNCSYEASVTNPVCEYTSYQRKKKMISTLSWPDAVKEVLQNRVFNPRQSWSLTILQDSAPWTSISTQKPLIEKPKKWPIDEDPNQNTRLPNQENKEVTNHITSKIHNWPEDIKLFHGENQIDDFSSISQYKITCKTTTQSETHSSDLPPKIKNQNKQGNIKFSSVSILDHKGVICNGGQRTKQTLFFTYFVLK
jgi:hypothetical protein